ncbi:hypothetical protein RhiirC2_798198 [Rhizophagus irregularis]|uniref:Uncharacterized protein n=1 Tax=Rhizophagus irregularis TaxID=588596 RepID=A0A2N1M6T2_9GLOM|nr:hypothetical protein RhiirC2_798198 [Rhizophagus irregularis]
MVNQVKYTSLKDIHNHEVVNLIQLPHIIYSEHVFHKQNIYNTIYNLYQNNKNERPDSLLFLDILFEKIT